ncbi:hypothetical protein ACHAWF_009211, partial [Thalassiosira exigua]
VVVHNVLKFVRAKEVDRLVARWLAAAHDEGGKDGKEGEEQGGKEEKGEKMKIVQYKKPPRDNWLRVTLAEESMVGPFIKLINEGGEGGKAMVNARGGALFARRADDMSRGRNGGGGKRKGRDGDDDREGDSRPDGGSNKRQRPALRLLSDDEVRDAVTPLWRATYDEQLDQKSAEMVTKCAMKVVKEIKAKFRVLEREAKRGHRKGVKLYDWVAKKRAIEVEQPVPSPRKYGYRNKCEFTVGYRLVPIEEDGENEGDEGKEEAADGGDADAKEGEAPPVRFRKVPAAGFLAQGWSGGVYPPHGLRNVPDWSCGLADVLNDFLPSSPLPPYDSKVHRGVWRTFTLRCSLRTRECMVVVLHAPAKGGAGAKEDGSDDRTAEFEVEKERLVKVLTEKPIPVPTRSFPEDDGAEGAAEEDGGKEGEGDGIRVTSIFFQEYEGLSHPTPDHPVQHVYGKKFIEEKLGKCTFQISPGAFFQTNTEGAEVLYNIVVERIKEVSTDPQKTVLLDVCCGTGTIGLTCLKEGVVGKLVGVDIAAPAIADAKANAAKNGYADAATAKFVASPAEKALPDLLKQIPRDAPVVAVVDPARDGLHGVVVRTLRSCERIRRIVYVSCNPTATLVRDAAMLCAPPTKKYPGAPFKPTLSQPVDMFPMTRHCEMVMTLDRMSGEDCGKHQEKDG